MSIIYSAETAADTFTRRASLARAAVLNRRQDVIAATYPVEVDTHRDPDTTAYLTWEAVTRAGLALTHAEGVLSVYETARDLATRYSGEEAMANLQRYAIEVLSLPPGDTYSGRSNDARRAYNDGQREAATGIVRRY